MFADIMSQAPGSVLPSGKSDEEEQKELKKDVSMGVAAGTYSAARNVSSGSMCLSSVAFCHAFFEKLDVSAPETATVDRNAPFDDPDPSRFMIAKVCLSLASLTTVLIAVWSGLGALPHTSSEGICYGLTEEGVLLGDTLCLSGKDAEWDWVKLVTGLEGTKECMIRGLVSAEKDTMCESYLSLDGTTSLDLSLAPTKVVDIGNGTDCEPKKTSPPNKFRTWLPRFQSKLTYPTATYNTGLLDKQALTCSQSSMRLTGTCKKAPDPVEINLPIEFKNSLSSGLGATGFLLLLFYMFELWRHYEALYPSNSFCESCVGAARESDGNINQLSACAYSLEPPTEGGFDVVSCAYYTLCCCFCTRPHFMCVACFANSYVQTVEKNSGKEGIVSKLKGLVPGAASSGSSSAPPQSSSSTTQSSSSSTPSSPSSPSPSVVLPPAQPSPSAPASTTPSATQKSIYQRQRNFFRQILFAMSRRAFNFFSLVVLSQLHLTACGEDIPIIALKSHDRLANTFTAFLINLPLLYYGAIALSVVAVMVTLFGILLYLSAIPQEYESEGQEEVGCNPWGCMCGAVVCNGACALFSLAGVMWGGAVYVVFALLVMLVSMPLQSATSFVTVLLGWSFRITTAVRVAAHAVVAAQVFSLLRMLVIELPQLFPTAVSVASFTLLYVGGGALVAFDVIAKNSCKSYRSWIIEPLLAPGRPVAIFLPNHRRVVSYTSTRTKSWVLQHFLDFQQTAFRYAFVRELYGKEIEEAFNAGSIGGVWQAWRTLEPYDFVGNHSIAGLPSPLTFFNTTLRRAVKNAMLSTFADIVRSAMPFGSHFSPDSDPTVSSEADGGVGAGGGGGGGGGGGDRHVINPIAAAERRRSSAGGTASSGATLRGGGPLSEEEDGALDEESDGEAAEAEQDGEEDGVVVILLRVPAQYREAQRNIADIVREEDAENEHRDIVQEFQEMENREQEAIAEVAVDEFGFSIQP